MSAAVTILNTYGRTAPPFADVAYIPIQITFSSTAYATGSAGVAIDLTNALSAGAQPPSMAYINPSDVIGITSLQPSTNGFLAGSLVVGTATYTNLGSTTVRPNYALATCPATVRLFGTGSANHAGLGEVADGNITDVVNAFLVVARNGENV